LGQLHRLLSKTGKIEQREVGDAGVRIATFVRFTCGIGRRVAVWQTSELRGMRRDRAEEWTYEMGGRADLLHTVGHEFARGCR